MIAEFFLQEEIPLKICMLLGGSPPPVVLLFVAIEAVEAIEYPGACLTRK